MLALAMTAARSGGWRQGQWHCLWLRWRRRIMQWSDLLRELVIGLKVSLFLGIHSISFPLAGLKQGLPGPQDRALQSVSNVENT